MESAVKRGFNELLFVFKESDDSKMRSSPLDSALVIFASVRSSHLRAPRLVLRLRTSFDPATRQSVILAPGIHFGPPNQITSNPEQLLAQLIVISVSGG